ncbi:Outer membrane porin protein [Ralstonia condita]|jgi:predicted porin|uniref:Outer membrane porin protein n=1 Tax=Ralstonia condita TaxID=3058600 RepID=A0ABM9J604_9RALS|nr:porin [Ralstonia sp. LMG 7141]CAJ0783766.1 Outer membrane porin protein [Ralstonia sp. LMG 7141]
MRKTLLALAAMGLTGTAAAQSSVTLYGSIDQGVAYINNVRSATTSGSALRMDPGTMQPDRFGFRGTEDLGHGTQAIFQLESGFLGDSGNSVVAGKLFNRTAWVGLSNESLGNVQLGHQADFMFDYLGRLSNGFQLTNFYLFHPGNFDNLANQFQIDNAVRYVSPIFGGLQLGGMYGFGEVPGSPTKSRSYSLGAYYTNGGFRAAAAYTASNDRALDIAGRLGITNTLGTTLVPGTMTPMSSVKSFGAGALYQFSSLPVQINAVYTQTRITLGGANARAQNVDLGTAWHYSGANTLNVGYTFSKYEGARWNQFSLGNVYAFSKRTQVYVQGTYQRASGDAPSAAINGVGVSANRSQIVVSTGVHHSF